MSFYKQFCFQPENVQSFIILQKRRTPAFYIFNKLVVGRNSTSEDLSFTYCVPTLDYKNYPLDERPTKIVEKRQIKSVLTFFLFR